MESVPTDWSPWLIAGVGAAALVLLVVVMRPSSSSAARRLNDRDENDDGDSAGADSRGADSGGAASRGAPSLAQQRGIEREMSQLMTELSEMARQVSAQLDARSARLEKLI